MTEAEFRSLYERLRRQVPWGSDDRRGALNHLGPAQIQAAASEVRLGRTVSLAAPIEHHASADNPDPAQYRMVQVPGAAADGLEADGLEFTMRWIPAVASKNWLSGNTLMATAALTF